MVTQFPFIEISDSCIYIDISILAEGKKVSLPFSVYSFACDFVFLLPIYINQMYSSGDFIGLDIHQLVNPLGQHALVYVK